MHWQSYWAPCAFTGMHPQTTPQSRCPPQPFPPIQGSMFYAIHVTRDSTAHYVCARQVRGSILWNFCRLVGYLCRVVSLRQESGRVILNDWSPLRVSMCASAWTRQGPRGLPLPRIFMVLGGMKAALVRPPPRDLGVRGASIVRCGLSCLVDLNSDLYCLCGSLHGSDTFWARGLSWINKETTTITTTTGFLDWSGGTRSFTILIRKELKSWLNSLA